MKKTEISSIELERETIVGLIRNNKVVADVLRYISGSSFESPTYKNCFEAIRYLAEKNEEINPYAIANHLNNLSITNFDLQGGSIKEHLEELVYSISLNEKATIEHCQRLAKIEICRERFQATQNIIKFLKDKANWDSSIDSIINFTDQLWQGNLSFYTRNGESEFTKIFDDIERVIEERGNNPIKEFGYYSPFDRFNYLYDAIFSPGDIHLTASRSNVGKTALGFFLALNVIEKYHVPLLWLDSGEMLGRQMQMRAICALTRGRVSTYNLKTGNWRKNPELVKLVRGVWPRVNKIKELFHFKNVGGMSSQEICSVIRRFWLSQVGRFTDLPSFGSTLGGMFPVNYDYIKGVDAGNKDAAEWQEVGSHMENLKNLITQEVPAAIKTYLQLNRTAVNRGQKMGSYNDSESAFSMSDRVYHNVSNAYILRYKTTDELVAENQLFGNCVWKNVKARDFGEGVREAKMLVNMPDGSLQENYIHLDQNSFHWECKGDLIKSAAEMGQVYAEEDDEGDDVTLA